MKRRLYLRHYGGRKFRPLTSLIGQSTLQWNALHEWLGHVFSYIHGKSHVKLYIAAWHAVPNDRTKRSMLHAVSAQFYQPTWRLSSERHKEAHGHIEWLLREANKLEDDRNNAVHAPLTLSINEVRPSDTFGNVRAKNLANKDLLLEFRRIRDTADKLTEFAAMLLEPIMDDDISWPERPRLPSRAGSRKG